MKSTLLKMSFLILVSLSVGCQALKMDYGQPAAQFLEKDVATAGKKYLGKKNHHTCRELTTNRWSSVARGGGFRILDDHDKVIRELLS